MKKLLLFLFIGLTAYAQSVEIIPGSVLPQMTTAQRTAVSSPKNGMLVFDINTQSYWFRQSGAWTELPKGGSTANYWQLTGNVIKNTNTGGFWSANPSFVEYDGSNPPTAPVSGAGTRLMWIPSRSAFRAGTVTDAYWNADSIGVGSVAFGYNTMAKGTLSTAMGYQTSASGQESTAMGYHTSASGLTSTAMGEYTKASGYASTAMGRSNSASGSFSTSLGYYNIASGSYSTAMGSYVNASRKGTFFIGDSQDSNRPPVNWDDQFLGAFYHGYVLKTRGGGVSIGGGETAWSSLSDSTKKENFLAANGEDFLHKLRDLKLGSWSYKGDINRNYGPMAQEIFSAYGNDALGVIGCDTLVSTLNMDGLLFIFSQALEKRTRQLTESNEQLSANIEQLTVSNEQLIGRNEQSAITSEQSRAEINKLKEQNAKLSIQNQQILERLEKLEKQATSP